MRVIMVPHRHLIMMGSFVAVLGIASSVQAQDRLDAIMKKEKLTQQDKATLKAEVAQRCNRLLEPDTSPELRADQREKLVRSAKIDGASPAGLEAYAEYCAEELIGTVAGENYALALAAIMTLVDLDHAKCMEAYVAALASEHAAVRYLGAKGIKDVQVRVKDDRGACSTALGALGRAGATEKDELVLRMVYEAIDFPKVAKDFKFGGECAAALSAVFAGRLAKLEAGSRDELKDGPGIAYATTIYKQASPEQQAELIGLIERLMESAVNRYFESDTAKEFRPRLAGLINQEEQAIHAMIEASGKKPPGKKVEEALKGGSASDNQKAEAKAAMDDLRKVLAGEPWKLP